MKTSTRQLTDALSHVAGDPSPTPDLGDVRHRADNQIRRRRISVISAATVTLVVAIVGATAWQSTHHQSIQVPADDPTTTAPAPLRYSRALPDGSVVTARITPPVAQAVQWGPYSDSGWHRGEITCGSEQLTVHVQHTGRPELTGTIEWPLRRLDFPGPAGSGLVIPAEPMQPLTFGAPGVDLLTQGPSASGFLSTGRRDGERLRATFSDGSSDETTVTGGIAIFLGPKYQGYESGQAFVPWQTNIDTIDVNGTPTRIFTGSGAMADAPMTALVPAGPCADSQILPETVGPADAVTQSNAITDTVRRTFGPGTGPEVMYANVVDATPELTPAFERVTTKPPGFADIDFGKVTTIFHEVRFVGTDTAWVLFGQLSEDVPDLEIPGLGGWLKLVRTADGWRVTRDSICGVGGWNGAPDDVCAPPENVPNG